MSLIKNSRFYFLLTSGILSGLIYLWIKNTVPEGDLQIIRLTQVFALAAITYLYLTLLITPLTRYFSFLPFRGELVKLRRAVGVSAFYFGLLHAGLAFFGQLGGFDGLFFLPFKYLTAITLSFTALVILTLMALTAFDFMIEKLGFFKWKILHRLIYLAAILILVHALMLGTHFQDFSRIIPQISFLAISFLMILEAKRFDEYLEKKVNFVVGFGLTMLIILSCISALTVFYLLPTGGGNLNFGIHSQHIQLAKEAQKSQGNSLQANNNIPGLKGDPTKRFTVGFYPPKNVDPNKDVELNFQINDASSGSKVLLFEKLYEKVSHLVIVDNELEFYNHIHPEQTVDGFKIITNFPHPGRYRLYISFQPLGAIEQEFAFTLDVGKFENENIANQQPDTNLEKVFGNVKVKLDYPKPLKSSEISVGNQQLNFFISDSKGGQPVITLKPYLGAFGHLVMINTKSYDYLHVHPVNLVPSGQMVSGGPEVDFLPLGLYGPIKPGIYRIFAQFNPNNELFTADFTVEVE